MAWLHSRQTMLSHFDVVCSEAKHRPVVCERLCAFECLSVCVRAYVQTSAAVVNIFVNSLPYKHAPESSAKLDANQTCRRSESGTSNASFGLYPAPSSTATWPTFWWRSCGACNTAFRRGSQRRADRQPTLNGRLGPDGCCSAPRQNLWPSSKCKEGRTTLVVGDGGSGRSEVMSRHVANFSRTSTSSTWSANFQIFSKIRRGTDG